MGPLPGLIAALLLASPRAQLDAAVATSAHAASDYPGPLGPDAARSLDVEPGLKILVQEPALRVQGDYAAGLLLTAAGESPVVGRRTRPKPQVKATVRYAIDGHGGPRQHRRIAINDVADHRAKLDARCAASQAAEE